MLNPLHLGVSSDMAAIGGLNRYAREITLAQRAEGISASLFGRCDSDELFTFGIKSERQHSFDILGLSEDRRLLKKLENDYAVFDIHFALSALPTIGSQKPSVVHFQGPWFLESLSLGQSFYKVRIKKFIETFIYKKNSTFITLSNAFADLLINEYNIQNKFVQVIPPGISIPSERLTQTQIQNFRHFYNLEFDDPLIISVRRLVPRMGLEVLIAAMAKIPDPPKLLIIGDGPLKASLQQQIGELKLEEIITLTGKISETDLQIAYTTADLSILPTIELEGFGLSALESMSYGTPVIATKCGGLIELMQGLPDEWSISPNSIDELSESISRFFKDEYNSNELCLNHVKKYEWKKVVSATNECYSRVVES